MVQPESQQPTESYPRGGFVAFSMFCFDLYALPTATLLSIIALKGEEVAEWVFLA